MNERNLNEGQWEDRKQWSLGVGQRRKTFWTRYIHTRYNGFKQLRALRNLRFVVLTTENMKIAIFLDVMPSNLICPYRQASMPSSHKSVIFIQWNCYAFGMETSLCSGVYIICWYIHLAVSAYEKAFSILPYPASHFPCSWSLLPCLLCTFSLIWYLHLFLHLPILPLCSIFNFSIHRNFVIDITQTNITSGFLCLEECIIFWYWILSCYCHLGYDTV